MYFILVACALMGGYELAGWHAACRAHRRIARIGDSLLNANIDLSKQAGVDSFRLDTFKHFETDFWLEQGRRTRAEISKDFFLSAEYWGGTSSSLDPFFAQGKVDAGFDYSFKDSSEVFVNGRSWAVA